MTDEMVRYVCLVCGYIYDPEIGDSKAGIPPGVEFDALPDDWVCPECGAGKDQFVKVQE
jgi:rubredoxin